MSKLCVKNICKSFGKHVVLEGLNFTADNTITFLAGKNGAGKTTFIRIALGLEKRDGGSVDYQGRAIDEIRDSVGVVLDDAIFFDHLSGYKNIQIINSGFLRDNQFVMDIYNSLELDKQLLNRPVKTYSFGQRHRLAMAMAMIRNPRFLFLDEPTIGLDPTSWQLVRSSIIRMKENGCTIVVTGQDYEEMQSLADEIVILHKGKSIYAGDIDQLIRRYPYEITFQSTKHDAVGSLNFPCSCEDSSLGIMKKYVVKCDEQDLDCVTKQINDPSIRGTDLTVNRISLKNAFLEMIGGD